MLTVAIPVRPADEASPVKIVATAAAPWKPTSVQKAEAPTSSSTSATNLVGESSTTQHDKSSNDAITRPHGEKVEALDIVEGSAPDGDSPDDFEVISAHSPLDGWDADWEPLVEDLREMGFDEADGIRTALVRHSGSLKLAVKERVAHQATSQCA